MRLLFALSFLAVACTRTTEPPQIDLSLAVHIDPPAVYAQWWHELEACSGLTGDFNAVSFYKSPGYDFVVDGRDYWGFWTARDNKIIIADAWTANKKLVWHEEMHALLKRSDHPAQYFNGPCGDLTYPNGE